MGNFILSLHFVATSDTQMHKILTSINILTLMLFNSKHSPSLQIYSGAVTAVTLIII